MADQKFIPAPVTSTVSRDGQSVADQAEPELSSVWNWLPKARRDQLLDECFRCCCYHSSPQDGEPFIQDGVPSSTPLGFAECLADEFRERLFQMLSARGEGPYYTLPDPPASWAAAK